MEIVRKTIDKDLEYLRQVSEPVDFAKDDVEVIAAYLKEFCTKQVLYALAPVQIGIPKRMIYFKNTTEDMTKNETADYDENCILVNPKILSQKGHARFLEGCDSCLDYCAVVDRPYEVTVEFESIGGKKHIEVFKGFKAVVFSHEFDHLNGILHIDRSKEIERLSFDERKQYRQVHPYEVISEDCDFEYPEIDWFKMEDKRQNI